MRVKGANTVISASPQQCSVTTHHITPTPEMIEIVEKEIFFKKCNEQVSRPIMFTYNQIMVNIGTHRLGGVLRQLGVRLNLGWKQRGSFGFDGYFKFTFMCCQILSDLSFMMLMHIWYYLLQVDIVSLSVSMGQHIIPKTPPKQYSFVMYHFSTSYVFELILKKNQYELQGHRIPVICLSYFF